MQKINYSEELEKEHLEYFKNNIKLDLEHVNFEDEKLQALHKKFINFCNENIEKIAIGKPSELKELIKTIEKEHKEIVEIIKEENNNFNEKKIGYGDELLKIFQYNEFSNGQNNLSVYNFISKKAIKLYNKHNQEKRKNYSKKMSLYAQQVIRSLGYSCDFENKEKDSEELKSFIEKENINITADNYYKITDEMEWCAYKLVFKSNIRVCPYCNRQYITPIFSDDGKLRGDLDHFFPKSKYPYLSMSLYNLIPSCKFCNSSLKGSYEFDVDSINPLEDSYGAYFDFMYDTINSKIFVVEKEDKRKIEKYLNLFKIESLYNYNKNQGEELIDKRTIYPDSYIEELVDEYGNLFSNEKQVKELIFGYFSEEEKINDEAFSKLRRDIAAQINILDAPVEEEIIEKLEKIKTSIII